LPSRRSSRWKAWSPSSPRPLPAKQLARVLIVFSAEYASLFSKTKARPLRPGFLLVVGSQQLPARSETSTAALRSLKAVRVSAPLAPRNARISLESCGYRQWPRLCFVKSQRID
jgi:hypothetical protein